MLKAVKKVTVKRKMKNEEKRAEIQDQPLVLQNEVKRLRDEDSPEPE